MVGKYGRAVVNHSPARSGVVGRIFWLLVGNHKEVSGLSGKAQNNML